MPAVKLWFEIASYIVVFLSILLVSAVVYLEFFAPEDFRVLDIFTQTSTPQSEPVEEEGQIEAPPALDPEEELASPMDFFGPFLEDAEPEEEKPGVFQGVVSRGATAGELFQEWLNPAEIRAMVDTCKNVFPLNKLRAGQPYTIYAENGVLNRFEYEQNTETMLIVTRERSGEGEETKDTWTAVLEPIQYEVRLTRVEGVIDGSLFESVAKAGERPALAVRLAEIFAWEINFIRDIQPGDSFRVLVEKRYRDNEAKSYGLIRAAEFINRGSKYEAYLYEDSFGSPAYFNAAGDSLKRAFLKAPLQFTRISSRFNLTRMHPILRRVRPHPAVDYAAPAGTPVMAIGSGTVAFRGWGKGAGNYITLKHAGGYESMYLHLSGFAKTLKQGGRVRQGEVIGYVGSTGYSTGPHLDFRLKRNGQFMNPEKVLSPRDESVSKKSVEGFKAQRDVWRQYLQGQMP